MESEAARRRWTRTADAAEEASELRARQVNYQGLIKLELPVPGAVEAFDVDPGVVPDVDVREISFLQWTPLLQWLPF